MTRYVAAFLAFVSIIGCGVYTFRGHGIAGIKTIAVEPFDNNTSEFGIREDLTDTIISRLLSDRTLSIADRGSADALLLGVLESVDDHPLTYTAEEVVSEYEIAITVRFNLTKPDRTEPVWSSQLTGRGSYPFEAGSLETRQEGIDQALDFIAEDLINKLTSDW